MSNAVDYGPLQGLIGTWAGDKGLDVSPEPDGIEENPYFERIVFDAIGTATNAESQTLAVLRYHQVVSRKSNGKVFHDQVGYWTWDAAEGVLTQSVSIPRAVALLAGGSFDGSAAADGPLSFEVSARAGDEHWGIAQSTFMAKNARTVEFRHEVKIDGDSFSYAETTVLDIYGKRFDHTDANTLVRSGG